VGLLCTRGTRLVRRSGIIVGNFFEPPPAHKTFIENNNLTVSRKSFSDGNPNAFPWFSETATHYYALYAGYYLIIEKENSCPRFDRFVPDTWCTKDTDFFMPQCYTKDGYWSNEYGIPVFYPEE
jgi:hypothetical protein